MNERQALRQMAWARQSADPQDKVLNGLEHRGFAIRTGARPRGLVEWRITAAGAEALYSAMKRQAAAA